MNRLIFSKVTGGELSDSAEMEFRAALAQHEDKEVSIKVARKKKCRSLNQNAYYWSVVVPAVRAMLEEYGNDVDDEETHAFCKEHVGKLTSSVVGGKGNRLAIVKSSAKLDTKEFENYINRVVAFAASEGIVIPPPHLKGY
jgi:hypothetical protein